MADQHMQRCDPAPTFTETLSQIRFPTRCRTGATSLLLALTHLLLPCLAGYLFSPPLSFFLSLLSPTRPSPLPSPRSPRPSHCHPHRSPFQLNPTGSQYEALHSHPQTLSMSSSSSDIADIAECRHFFVCILGKQIVLLLF